MPQVAVNGVSLHYEETGQGTPLVFVHEFAGDHRSWEHQLRFFGRRFRTVAYNARGYPPSDVPADPAAYSQDIAIADLLALLDALDIDKAHLCGLSMGSYTALLTGLRHPDRVRSMTISGSGYGSGTTRQEFHDKVEGMAQRFETEGVEAVARDYCQGATRVQHQNKDPRGWQEFYEQFCDHSPVGSANTLRGVQKDYEHAMTELRYIRSQFSPSA